MDTLTPYNYLDITGGVLKQSHLEQAAFASSFVATAAVLLLQLVLSRVILQSLQYNENGTMRWSLLCLLLLLAQQASCADDTGDDTMTDDYYAMQQDDAANYNPYDYNQKVNPCEKGVVQVTAISLECNSPCTYIPNDS